MAEKEISKCVESATTQSLNKDASCDYSEGFDNGHNPETNVHHWTKDFESKLQLDSAVDTKKTYTRSELSKWVKAQVDKVEKRSNEQRLEACKSDGGLVHLNCPSVKANKPAESFRWTNMEPRGPFTRFPNSQDDDLPTFRSLSSDDFCMPSDGSSDSSLPRNSLLCTKLPPIRRRRNWCLKPKLPPLGPEGPHAPEPNFKSTEKKYLNKSTQCPQLIFAEDGNLTSNITGNDEDPSCDQINFSGSPINSSAMDESVVSPRNETRMKECVTSNRNHHKTFDEQCGHSDSDGSSHTITALKAVLKEDATPSKLSSCDDNRSPETVRPLIGKAQNKHQTSNQDVIFANDESTSSDDDEMEKIIPVKISSASQYSNIFIKSKRGKKMKAASVNAVDSRKNKDLGQAEPRGARNKQGKFCRFFNVIRRRFKRKK